MASEHIAKLLVDIQADMARYERQLEKIEKKSKKSGKKASNSFKSGFAGIAKSAMPIVGVAGAVALLGNELKKSFNRVKNFDKAMRNVNTIMKVSDKQLGRYSDQIRKLAVSLGGDVVDLADALYQAASAGVEAGDSMQFLETAAKAAKAGLSSTETAVDLLTTVLNSYQMEASEAGDVSDILFRTVELGKTTFAELAASMSNVTPFAAASGVSFKQVAAAIATLTKQGVPTTQATTQIRAALISMNETLGDSWSKTMTFNEAAQEMMDKAGGSATELKHLMGRVEGVSAVLALVGPNAKGAADDFDNVRDSAESMGRAFEEQTKSMQTSLERLGAWWDNEWDEMTGKSTGSISLIIEAFLKLDKLLDDLTDSRITKWIHGGIIDPLSIGRNAAEKLAKKLAAAFGMTPDWNIPQEDQLAGMREATKAANAQAEAVAKLREETFKLQEGEGDLDWFKMPSPEPVTLDKFLPIDEDEGDSYIQKELEAQAKFYQDRLEQRQEADEKFKRQVQATNTVIGNMLHSGFAEAFSGLRVEVSKDASMMERVFGSMANAFIAAVQRMIVKAATLALLNALLPGSGGAATGIVSALFGAQHGGRFQGGRKMQSGGSFDVPHGFQNDRYPIMVDSGERVEVTSRGQTTAQDAALQELTGAITAMNENLVRGGSGGDVNINLEGESRIDKGDIQKSYDKQIQLQKRFG